VVAGRDAAAQAMSGHVVDIAVRTASRRRPPVRVLRQFAQVALAAAGAPRALAIALVGRAEMCQLNGRYRGVQRPTNVLAFAAQLLPMQPAPACAGTASPAPLGDLVVCVPVVADEAHRHAVGRDARFAHMLVHGVLHLLGHDHEEAGARRRMERAERRLLAGLGFGDPYVCDAAAVATGGAGAPPRRARPRLPARRRTVARAGRDSQAMAQRRRRAPGRPPAMRRPAPSVSGQQARR
jgi:probable rRNA maturation factor